MQHAKWRCPKCEHDQFETGEMRAEGGVLSAVFDVSTNKYSAVTCSRCSYTEFYRSSAGSLGQVFDFFAT
jgi:predicted nucleic-acid-binding Zn-ribbon protein